MSYLIPEQLVVLQAALVKTRQDARWRAQRTRDPTELWALREIVHKTTRLIEEAFPIDYIWWIDHEAKRCRTCGGFPAGE